MTLVRFLKTTSYARIIITMLITLALVHLLRSFQWNSNHRDVTTAPLFQQSLLPWYKTGHAALHHLQPVKFSTAHLTTAERQALQAEMVARAQQLVQQEFQATGIRGTIYQDDLVGTERFRQQVDCWTDTGSWQRGEPDVRIPHFQDPLYGSCDRKHHSQQPRAATQYRWQSRCAMQRVNTSQWCSTLKGRHILLVGDLVQYQLHDLLLDLLREGPAVCFGELNCKDHTLCDGEIRLRYLRNDLLSVRRKMNYNGGKPLANVIEWPFTSSSLMRSYSTVIINRSPVLESDLSFMNGLLETLKTMRKQNPNALLIYRSSGIGHPFCDDAEGPLASSLDDETIRALPYGWSELDRRNAIARVLVEGAGGLFIDLAKVTNMRPDGHVGGLDCLRYCIPGPLDGWAQILYQVFLGLEQKHV
ncbi:MAG: hypothetical protein EXX96DRAFT_582944 [Benjaminiella poitrasii]|nr:MAG: hypothetical protein EXX96DRAFT_582944 [Benjaminiella poitrasii]